MSNQMEQRIVRTLTVVLVVLILLAGSLIICEKAGAEEKLPMRFFPVWELLQCPEETYACYTFDQAKNIIRLDLEFQMKEAECSACMDNSSIFTETAEKLNMAYSRQKDSIDMLTENLAAKEKQFDDIRMALKEAEQHTVGHYLPWIITGVLLAATFSFLGGWVAGAQ
jgi:hypothetical protein